MLRGQRSLWVNCIPGGSPGAGPLWWVQSRKQPATTRWGDSSGVCLLCYERKNKPTYFQPKQDSGICGPTTREKDPGGFRSMSAGAERTQGCLQKRNKCTHAHTHKMRLSRQTTVLLVEKYCNPCINLELWGNSGTHWRHTGNQDTNHTIFIKHEGRAWQKKKASTSTHWLLRQTSDIDWTNSEDQKQKFAIELVMKPRIKSKVIFMWRSSNVMCSFMMLEALWFVTLTMASNATSTEPLSLFWVIGFLLKWTSKDPELLGNSLQSFSDWDSGFIAKKKKKRSHDIALLWGEWATALTVQSHKFPKVEANPAQGLSENNDAKKNARNDDNCVITTCVFWMSWKAEEITLTVW